MKAQSREAVKRKLRELLDTAYQLISNLCDELDCDRTLIFSSSESINDRNVLSYLAAIESRVQQMLPASKIHRKGGGHHSYIDDTTISWRIDQRTADQSAMLTSASGNKKYVSDHLHQIDSVTPPILS